MRSIGTAIAFFCDEIETAIATIWPLL
jgi:hypothetical protein